ncbi:MAG: hypothetical protein AB1390_10015 [Nitrospirota bacterium]
MEDIRDMALKIFHAFEDLYFEGDKGKIFEEIFARYFPLVEIDWHMDVYDVLVSLGTNYQAQFDKMVLEFKAHSLISD